VFFGFQFATMSRFFATGSDSESVSSETDEEVVQKPVVATKCVSSLLLLCTVMLGTRTQFAIELFA